MLNKNRDSRGMKAFRKVVFLVLLPMVLIISTAALIKYRWHERVWFIVAGEFAGDRWVGNSIWLPDYKVRIDAQPIAGVVDDISAVTYDYDRDRLLAVTNGEGSEVIALSKAGEVLERYPLKGFTDVEGMAYMGNGQVVLLEEITQRLNFVKLPETGGVFDSKNAQYLSLGTRMNSKNKGLEGVSYDAEHDRLFVVKERDPRQLFEISGVSKSLDEGLHVEIRDLTQWIEHGVFAKDLSDIYYDPDTGHLALLSHESSLLIELSKEGEIVSFRTFLGRLSDLKVSAPQAEGVTMDHAGNLYMVSEPNLFYVFSKLKSSPVAQTTK